MGLYRWLHNELVPEARKSGISVTNWIIISLVLASFLFLALETEPTLLAIPEWKMVFDWFNVAVVIIFAVEYVLRVAIAGLRPEYAGFVGRLRYITRFYSIADLLAFLPELIVMVVGGGIPLIALRVFRLFRLIKIARFVPAFDVLGAAMKRAGTPCVLNQPSSNGSRQRTRSVRRRSLWTRHGAHAQSWGATRWTIFRPCSRDILQTGKFAPGESTGM